LQAPFDTFTVMPIQIFNWAQQAKPDFREHVAAAGIIVLLAMLLLLNTTAIVLRNRSQRKMKY
jgi:phosphate transport system permease protein